RRRFLGDQLERSIAQQHTPSTGGTLIMSQHQVISYRSGPSPEVFFRVVVVELFPQPQTNLLSQLFGIRKIRHQRQDIGKQAVVVGAHQAYKTTSLFVYCGIAHVEEASRRTK